MPLWALASIALLVLVYEIQTLTVGVLWPLLQNPSGLQTDFHYYYEAAQRFAADASRLYLASDDVIAGYAYPPLGILPFLALSKVLPLGGALLGFTLVSYGAVFAAVRLWCGHLRGEGIEFDTRTASAVILIVLVLGPTYSNAVFGQVNGLVLLSCVAFLTLGARRPVVAGLCLAAGIWLKVYPLLMLATGAWNRRMWNAIAAAVAATVLLAVIALPIVPLRSHSIYVNQVLVSRIDKTAIHVTNQSLVATLERLRYPSSRFLHWTGEQAVTISTPVRTGAWAAGLLALVVCWRRAASGRPGASAMSQAGLMALVALAAPLGWGHTYVMVLPLVVLRLVTLQSMNRAQAWLVACCILALMVPAGRMLHFADPWPDWLQNLLYSRYLIATVVLALLPLRQLPPPVEQVRS